MKKKPEGRVEKAKGLQVSAGPAGNVRNFPIHPRRLATCPRDAEALGDSSSAQGVGARRVRRGATPPSLRGVGGG